MVLAHEHAHALQDQHYDLETRMDHLEGDEYAALEALVEGEATIVMYVWAVKRLSLADWDEIEEPEELEVPSDYVPLESMPTILWRTGEFPYVDGAAFVYRFWEPGGWDAVEDMWEAPPVSTEQVMHPERYPHDVPDPVELPDLAARLGSDWSTATELTMGELQTSVLLAGGEDWDHGEEDDIFVFPTSANARAAEGWGGDRLAHLEGPDGAWAIVWQTTWDTARDASEFEDAMFDILGTDAYFDVYPGTDLTGSGLAHPVLVAFTESPETLTKVRWELDL
jgi:hypothetical protein